MAKIEDIPKMTVEELRPYIQRALELNEWPTNDWIVVGMIFDQISIRVDRASFPPYAFSIIVMGKEVGGGIGTGNDINPITAIFRAYLTWRSYQQNNNLRKR